MPKAAVVILNYNGVHHLEEFLPSVVKHSGNHSIIVVDNGSTDESVAFLNKHYSQVKLIEFKDNHGYCGGYNKAISQIEEEYLILLNSDIEVTGNWIDPVLELMDSNSEIAAAQPRILSYRQKEYFEYAGAAGGMMDKYGYPFCKGRIFQHLEKDESQYTGSYPIFWATGACLFIKKQAFELVGGFDASYFAHMEEIDLCWRLQHKGFKIFYCGESSIYHLGGGTLDYNNPRKTFLNFRNNLRTLIKNLPESERQKILRIRFFLDMVAAIQFLLKGQTKLATAVVKAYREINAEKSNLISQRELIQPSDSFSETIYPKSILFQFYIKRKKVFSELPKN